MNERRPSSARGILALINGTSGTDNHSHKLRYIPINPQAERLRRNRLKRNIKNKRPNPNDCEEQDNAILFETLTHTNNKSYQPHDAEFTFIFFCDLNCMNSRRFTFILTDFLKGAQQLSSSYNGDEQIDNYQLICIPNDDITTYSEMKNGTIMSHLQSETNYWHLGFDHVNRLAIIRMLSISEVPTLVVISNKTGKVITFKGMEAIEWSEVGKPSLTFEKWRNGDSAVPLSATISKSCSIS